MYSLNGTFYHEQFTLFTYIYFAFCLNEDEIEVWSLLTFIAIYLAEKSFTVE